jgi:hypothetical protein
MTIFAAHPPAWTGYELYVRLFKVANEFPYSVVGMQNPLVYNANTDIALLNYCFWQTANVSGTIESQRISITDRPVKRIISDEFIYSCQVNSFFCMQAEIERTQVFNRRLRFHIVMFHYATGSARKAYMEQATLYLACPISFRLNGTENGVSSYDVEFAAENFDTVSLLI